MDREERGEGEEKEKEKEQQCSIQNKDPTAGGLGKTSFFLPPHLFHRDREQSGNYRLLLGKCG